MTVRARALLSVATAACLLTSLTAGRGAPVSAASTSPTATAGLAAVEALGSDISAVAKSYGMDAEELSHELTTDKALRLDSNNKLFYVDTDLKRPLDPSVLNQISPSPSNSSSSPVTASSWSYGGQDYTASDAFALHSRPSAPVRIYLDFNGHTTTGTAWNGSYGSTIVSQPLNYDGDVATFNAAERTVIGKVWAGVAEDFAPFNIDVTTQEPSIADLSKSDTSDTRFGIRVVVTPTSFLSAGGVAYIGSFSWNSDTPAFCFGANYSYDDMVLVISHEVGHTFGLHHDGTSSAGYYSGHGSWGPIMGAPYGKRIAQWSKGEYTSANNQEDDVSKIAAIAPYATDDFTDTMNSALTIQSLSTQGVISSASDKDWVKFSFGGGTLGVKLEPAYSPNLDAAVEVWRNGALVQRIDPTTTSIDTSIASLPAGEYYLSVDGTSSLDMRSTGYSDYGSIGQYLLTLSGTVSTDPPPAIEITPSKTKAVAGSTVSFGVTSTTHPTLSGVTLSWSFSNGTTGSGNNASTTMPATTLTATVTATTASGGVTVKSATVGVSRAPTVTAVATPTSTKAGVYVVFSAIGSDPDRQALTYAWSFSDGTTATGTTASKTSRSSGNLAGTVTVTDADGNTATASTSAAFTSNSAPTVTTAATSANFAAPATVSLAAIGKDPEGSALTYLWTFADSTTATTARATKVFPSAGSHTATVRVTDAQGFYTDSTVSFTVTSNSAPTISSLKSSALTLVSPGKFAFTATATDPNKQLLTYAWSFSNGTTASGAAVTKTFTQVGTQTATVTVSDPGGLTATQTISVQVTENHAPTVTASTTSSTTQAAPALFALKAVGADVDKQALTYLWEFSDGTTATTASVSKKFTTAGTVTAKVTVSDPGGLTATQTLTFTVTANRAPTISSATVSAASAPAGVSRMFSATGADADNQTLTYLWTFSDKSVARTKSFAKTMTKAGSYSVTLVVTDTGGLTATQTLTFTVT
jgi:PKD repeat protein